MSVRLGRRFVVNVTLSLLVGVVCVVFAAHGIDWGMTKEALRTLAPSTIGLYLATLAVVHLFRAWRWEYLLRALGVSLPFKRLMLISSAGFMAILALPVRLGELARPYYVSRETGARMSTLVGAVAVERIIDGFMISILFFVGYLASAGGVFSRELRIAAWSSLGGFVGATGFLIAAHKWPDRTISLALRLTLLPWIAPARARHFDEKLRAIVSGFRAFSDHRNFFLFLAQSVIYWGVNGLGMYLLARRMDLPISFGAAYVVMAFTGVILTLPNSPGLVGQFHAAIKAGLLAYLPAAVVNARGIAYAIVLHGVQAVWYVALGLAAMVALARTGAHAHLGDAVRESAEGEPEPEPEPEKVALSGSRE
jgi:uncharacterized protein (TIRG00374 family)